MAEISETFHVDAAMVEAFAALSGDRNALHMDAAFARRSRYRGRVAHGMVAVAHLALLQRQFANEGLRFRRLQGRFEAPIPLDTTLCLTVDLGPAAEGLVPFEAAWTAVQDGARIMTANGSLALVAASALEDRGEPCLLAAPVDERVSGPEDLAGAVETLPFGVSAAALDAIRRLTGLEPGLAVCPNLAATLLLSTLVGMRLPGRYATFTSFELAFARDLEPGGEAVLEGRVAKVSAASETLIAATRVVQGDTTIADGEIRALVNPPPRRMPTAAEIKAEHTGLGLAGKVVVVIGASRGIGETAAKLFAMHGARVVVHYFRGEADARAIVADIEAAGGRALALGADIREQGEVEALVEAAATELGGVDVLVNNAVMDFRPEPVTSLGWGDYLAELEVSLEGLHSCCMAVLPHLKARGGGRIINVSSIAVDLPVKGQSKYITAKSAVVGYTRSLALELARDNIQVNLVVPAMTETDLLASIPSDYIRRVGSARAMKRNLRPIEVAQAMVYLASSWSTGMSGQKLVLNLGEPPFA
jgi:3-oxoacyl-[acyl-carrier protein] reductase